MIDMSKVVKELETQPSQIEMMPFLSQQYPSLFVYMLRCLNMQKEIELYMSKCKKFENDPKNYSIYIHGYFLVWLDQQRKAGKLK